MFQLHTTGKLKRFYSQSLPDAEQTTSGRLFRNVFFHRNKKRVAVNSIKLESFSCRNYRRGNINIAFQLTVWCAARSTRFANVTNRWINPLDTPLHYLKVFGCLLSVDFTRPCIC